MTQALVDGLVAALLGAFPGVTVYTEQVRQGLKEPCFMLQIVEQTSQPRLAGRYYRTLLVSIQYIPQSATDAKAECAVVTDTLFGALEYIMVDGDLVRGTGMNGAYYDGQLAFQVNYNLFVLTKREVDTMGALAAQYKATQG